MSARGIAPGVAVSGELYLGVDPYFYFERLFRTPGMPPLIYEWQIEGIAIELRRSLNQLIP